MWCKLIDVSSGRVVWQDTIAQSYKAHFLDHLIGTERLRLASEGAMRKTIAEIINRFTIVKPDGLLNVSS